MRKVTKKDIPEDKVEKVVKIFTDDGCEEVKREKQPDGRWTVEFLCPNE